MFEEVELSTLTKINQTIQLLAVIANKPQWLYHLSFFPRPFKFGTVIALSTFAGIDLAINCFCGKIFFKKTNQKDWKLEGVLLFKVQNSLSKHLFSLSLTHYLMIHNVLGGSSVHWVHLRSVLKMSMRKGRSLCELTDFKQRQQGTPCNQSVMWFPQVVHFRQIRISLLLVLMTNKSHSSGTPTVKKSSEIPQTLFFCILEEIDM